MSQSPFSEAINQLKPKQKEPRSARVLDGWVAQAQQTIGGEISGGRLGWLIASTVVVAALQRAVDEAGPLFLLKGGTLLQHRLGLDARATSDIDGLVRGDLTQFLVVLDKVIKEPWGPLGIERGTSRVHQDTISAHQADALQCEGARRNDDVAKSSGRGCR